MKRLIIAFLVAGLAAFGYSTQANAQEFHIKKLVCHETEGTVIADAIYLRYRIKRYPSSSDFRFVAGAERSDFLYLTPGWGATIHIELWDHDTFDPDDYLGSFEVKVNEKKEQWVYIRQNDGTAYYHLIYVIE